jgi:hypothetical protein
MTKKATPKKPFGAPVKGSAPKKPFGAPVKGKKMKGC